MKQGSSPASSRDRAFKWAPALQRRIALELSIAAGSMLVHPEIAMADDEVRASAEVTSTSGWSSNPFGGGGSDLGAGYVQVSAAPSVTLLAENSQFTLDSRLNYQHYFRRYSDSDDYGGGLAYTGTLSPRLTAGASARYDSSIVGGFDAINPVVNPSQPQTVATTGPEIALIGTRERRGLLSFAGNAGYTLSDRDSLNADAYYNQSRYGGVASATDFDGYGGSMGYSRRISEPLQLGAQVTGSRFVYQGVLGTTQVFSVQATAKNRFSDTWNIDGSLGVSFANGTISGKSTSPTGNLRLCRVSVLATLCFTASESELPTGGSGTVNSKSAGATYSYRLSERTSFSLQASYARNDQPATKTIPGITPLVLGTSYASATANLDRVLGQRIHLLVTTHYRKIMGNVGNYPADVGASFGISIHLGGYR